MGTTTRWGQALTVVWLAGLSASLMVSFGLPAAVPVMSTAARLSRQLTATKLAEVR